ncbi:MAG: radical SAM protein, partial [Desulfobacteraceae bacterium]|nr:radical SAM protein [Desulfobacteraceae bacterium]
MKIEKILLTKPGRKIVSSLVAFPFLRKLGMGSIDRVINQRLSEDREEWVPPLKVIEDQRHILHNMVKVVDRWSSDKHVTKSSLNNFLNSFGPIFSKSNDSVREEFAGKYGFSPPGFLTISPTKVCNLQCKGCYASSGADTNISLDFDVVNRIIEEKEKLWGATFTVISGGEPFMYKSQGKGILDLAQLHPSNFFLVYTNGTLIDKKIAHRIAELGNITPAISVEGFEKETDERRGNGVHKRILQAFENLREAGVLFGLSVTATRNNAETILSPEFIDYYLDQNGAYYMWIFQYMPIGRKYTLDLMVTPKQRKWMFEQEQH